MNTAKKQYKKEERHTMNNDNELYHYGVPGMKWGVRRAQKQLAKLTGRDRSKVSAEEAERFRKDVKSAKAMKDANTREQWVRSVSKKNASGKKYADAVLTQAKKERASKYIKGPAITAGVIATYPFLAAAAIRVSDGIAPVVKPIAKGIGKTLFWWNNI